MSFFNPSTGYSFAMKLDNYAMKRITVILIMLLGYSIANSQSTAPQPNSVDCASNVPYHLVNLTGQPAGQWTSPTHSRVGYCCTATTRCTYFEVILDSNAAMVEVGFDLVTDPSQAIPSGSLFYQVNCGPEVPVGSPICITGVGPHHITFCKPGNNQNTYYVRSISRPLFPQDDTVSSPILVQY